MLQIPITLIPVRFMPGNGRFAHPLEDSLSRNNGNEGWS